MSEIYVVIPKGLGSSPALPAHTTWQGASQELAKLPAYIQDHLEVVNRELIEDEE
jgi:hypothetical protein